MDSVVGGLWSDGCASSETCVRYVKLDRNLMPPSFSCTYLAEEIERDASISIPFLVRSETVEDPMLAEEDPSSKPVCRTGSELYQSKI